MYPGFKMLLVILVALFPVLAFPTSITASNQPPHRETLNEAISLFKASPHQFTKTLVFISEQPLSLTEDPQFEPWQVELSYEQASKTLRYCETTYGDTYQETSFSEKDLTYSPYHDLSLLEQARLTGLLEDEGGSITYYFSLEKANLQILVTVEDEQLPSLKEAKYLWEFPQEKQFLLHQIFF